MAGVEFVPVPNNSSHVTFDDLRLGRSPQQILCRLIRFWDSRNIRRDNEFMGITILFLDEKNSVIHGFIPATIADQFRPLLREGLNFKITSFDVGRCTKMYKITDSPFVIRFMDHTVISPVETAIPIERVKFMLRKVDQLQALANTNLELPDVVGQIRFLQGPNLKDPTSTQRLVVRFLIDPEVTVYLTLWDDAAATFRSHLSSGNQLHSIMIVTTVNPKLFGGNLYLNSTAATRFYFDSSIEAITNFAHSLGMNGNSAKFPHADTTETLNKMETVCISELHQYISHPPEEDADFLCKATVVGVLQGNGWSYVSCGDCSTKLNRNGTALRCNKCVSSRITGIVRYRVELAVTDSSGSATFVVFDSEMTKQTSRTAASLTAEMNEEDTTAVPPSISALAEKTYMFQIRVRPFNFTSRHKTFTVAKMTELPNPEIGDGDEGPLPGNEIVMQHQEPQIQIADHSLADNEPAIQTVRNGEAEGSNGNGRVREEDDVDVRPTRKRSRK